MEKFKVSEDEIPTELRLQLGAMDRCLLARLLTAYGIPMEYVGDTLHHLFKKGLKEVYNKEFTDDKAF